MIVHRQTLAQPITWAGAGLHTGAAVKVTAHPSSEGIHFRHLGSRYRAVPSEVTDTTRCTRLGTVAVIEHLMSALAACEVTDVEIEVEGPELPALGGNALGYYQAIQAAGFDQVGDAEYAGLFARVYHKGDGFNIAVAKGEGWWRYLFDSGERFPGTQEFEWHAKEGDYGAEIAPARTFAFDFEVEMLRKAGLGLGLDAESALVLSAEGYVNPPLFPDEPARHKLLDLIGDLYLAGVPIRELSVVAEKSGHTANVATAAKLIEVMQPR